MAGFLSPQISEVGGVQGVPAQRSVADTSVGDALKNVSSIFDAVISSGAREEGTVGTQTDRDRAAMQRYTQDFKRLGKLVRSGQMSSSEAQARGTSLLLEATALFPDKTTQLKDFASSVLGVNIMKPSEDPMQQARDAVFTEIANSDDPQMMRIARKALQESGGDQGRYESAALRLYAEQNAKEARTADLLDEVQRAEAIGKLDKAREDQISEIKFNEYTQEVNDRVEELTLTLGGKGEQINVSDALQSVIKIKAELKGEIVPEVAELRIADNFKTKYGGVDAVLAPLTVIENELRSMRQEDLDAAQARATFAPDRLAKILTDAGNPGIFAYTEEGRKFVFESAMFSKLKDINPDIELTRAEHMIDNPYYGKTGGETGIDSNADKAGSDTVMDEDALGSIGSMNKDEATRAVKSGKASFFELGNRKDPTEEDKSFAVENFVIGLEVMTNKGLNFNESSFDSLYGNDEFFDVYNTVVEEGGSRANVLNNSVRRHLRAQRLLKEADVNADLGQVERLPSAHLVFNGEKYTIKLNALPKTEEEEILIGMLNDNGLPLTLEGIKQLDPRKFPPTTKAIPGGPQIGRWDLISTTKDNLRLLNKIVGTVPKLAEDAQVGILPSEESIVTENVIEVNDRESLQNEFDKAPDGTIFETRSEDGSVFRAQKINGQLVPFGGR